MTDNSILPIPERFRAQCELCNRQLDTRKEGTHQWTSGWVMVRAGGGGHGISRPERDPKRWACDWCIRDTGQVQMFGGGS